MRPTGSQRTVSTAPPGPTVRADLLKSGGETVADGADANYPP
jgi:hypothetical protein